MIGGNLLPNCGFESGTTGWTATGLQAVGGRETGSAGYFNDTQAGLGDLLSPCVAVAPGTDLLVGLVARGHGPASTPDCILNVEEYTDGACGVPAGSTSASGVVALIGPYQPLEGPHTVAAGAASVALRLSCFQQTGFEVVADNAFVVFAPAPIPLSRPGLAALAVALALAGTVALRFASPS